MDKTYLLQCKTKKITHTSKPSKRKQVGAATKMDAESSLYQNDKNPIFSQKLHKNIDRDYIVNDKGKIWLHLEVMVPCDYRCNYKMGGYWICEAHEDRVVVTCKLTEHNSKK